MNTLDFLLDSRICVEQPSEGYRIAVDTLLLASTISENNGARILDMGCGVGGVMLAVACRLESAHITGLELQSDLAELCRKNIERNHFAGRLSVEEGSATQAQSHMAAQFDQVMMNPPFHDSARHDGSPNKSKERANLEQRGEIEQWIASAAHATHEDGVLSMITRTDRRDEMIEKLNVHFPHLYIKPIWSNDKGRSKRILLRGFKKGETGVWEQPPFILYGPDGRYSEAGNRLLREAEEMEF
ncbi:MAG: tRNA1(Val) (adenine(37)-N6)-methyltransferase [Bdellovibrionales bacterium]